MLNPADVHVVVLDRPGLPWRRAEGERVNLALGGMKVLWSHDLPHILVAVGHRPPPPDFRAYLARHAGNSFGIEVFQGLESERMPFPVPLASVP